MPREEIDAFLRMIPADFTDALTNVRPGSERELSAVLAARHHLKQIHWTEIPLWSRFPLQPHGDASSIVDAGDYVFCEYPLFASSQNAIDRWGAMAPDLAFLSTDRQRVTLVECKVDSHFTHDDNPPNGQLSRYLEFLHHLAVKRRGLLLICPACNQDWYAKRLALAADNGSPEVFAMLTTWEKVFAATRST